MVRVKQLPPSQPALRSLLRQEEPVEVQGQQEKDLHYSNCDQQTFF
jgi:hypothetical protein